MMASKVSLLDTVRVVDGTRAVTSTGEDTWPSGPSTSRMECAAVWPFTHIVWSKPANSVDSLIHRRLSPGGSQTEKRLQSADPRFQM